MGARVSGEWWIGRQLYVVVKVLVVRGGEGGGRQVLDVAPSYQDLWRPAPPPLPRAKRLFINSPRVYNCANYSDVSDVTWKLM